MLFLFPPLIPPPLRNTIFFCKFRLCMSFPYSSFIFFRSSIQSSMLGVCSEYCFISSFLLAHFGGYFGQSFQRPQIFESSTFNSLGPPYFIVCHCTFQGVLLHAFFGYQCYLLISDGLPYTFSSSAFDLLCCYSNSPTWVATTEPQFNHHSIGNLYTLIAGLGGILLGGFCLHFSCSNYFFGAAFFQFIEFSLRFFHTPPSPLSTVSHLGHYFLFLSHLSISLRDSWAAFFNFWVLAFSSWHARDILLFHRIPVSSVKGG